MDTDRISFGRKLLLRTTNLQKIFIPVGLVLILIAPMHLKAQNYDMRDVSLLPVYCKYTQDFRERVPGGNNQDEIKRWSSVLGSTYIHMHHYCYGLVATNRATMLSRTPLERTHHLKISINEFDYVIQRAPPDFVLLPEILTKKGESLVRMGRGPLATLEFSRAIQLKPDYWPPYAYTSDYYKSAGDLVKARDWLEKGLSVSPDAKGLQIRLAELGGSKGKRPPPAPAVKKPATASPPETGVTPEPAPQGETPEPSDVR